MPGHWATTKYIEILNLDVFVKNSPRPNINVFYPSNIFVYVTVNINALFKV